MLNRESMNPGRVLITPEDGAAPFYATMERADNPTVEGSPLNKATLLKDQTAALFGLGVEAVPDDVLWLLSQYIPSPYGLIIIQAVDNNGEPAAASLAVSPSVEGASEFAVGSNGFYSVYAQPGTYTLSNPSTSSAYQTISPSSMEITVEAGKPVVAKFSVASSDHGEIDITASGTFVVPDWMTSIDIFAVGGGASGCANVYKGGYASHALGGGGGYTKTLLNQNLAGKTLTITIGAGGAAAKVSDAGASYDSGQSADGKNGGTTSVVVDGTTLLSASGGIGGSESSYSGECDGGSGGGWQGGSDGSDGKTSSGAYAYGTGQGTTTRKFGESSGELFSGGGGGADGSYGAGAGGSGGGGSGSRKNLSAAANSYHYGGNATKAGGGGGAVLVHSNYSGVSLAGETAVSGKGYRGLVSIRW